MQETIFLQAAGLYRSNKGCPACSFFLVFPYSTSFIIYFSRILIGLPFTEWSESYETNFFAVKTTGKGISGTSLQPPGYVITFGIIMLVNMLPAALFPDTGNSISYLVISFITDLLLSILSVGPVTILLDMSRGSDGQLSDLLYAFRHQPDRIIVSQLIISILSTVIFLPGIIVFVLSSVFYNAFGIMIASLLIFAAVIGSVVIRLDFALVTPLYIDNPQTSAIDLLRESHDLMQGNRLRYFVLELSFIPIMLLAVIACFVGLLWALPYAQMTLLEFYRELVGEI